MVDTDEARHAKVDENITLLHNTHMTNHHAIVCIADSLDASIVPEIYKTQSSDVSHIILDRFSIADARQLSIDALQKPVQAQYRVFVIVAKKLPEESQNALLKLFEEPPTQTRFYLVIPQEGLLIPTLRSRVLIEESGGIQADKNDTFATFLSSSYADRLTHVTAVTKEKDIEEIENIICGAEKYAAEHSVQNPQLLSTVLFIRKYIRTPGASAKMLLEELALTLPKV